RAPRRAASLTGPRDACPRRRAAAGSPAARAAGPPPRPPGPAPAAAPSTRRPAPGRSPPARGAAGGAAPRLALDAVPAEHRARLVVVAEVPVRVPAKQAPEAVEPIVPVVVARDA